VYFKLLKVELIHSARFAGEETTLNRKQLDYMFMIKSQLSRY